MKNAPKESREKQAEELASELDMCKLYTFVRMEQLLSVSHVLKDIYRGANRLYKNPDTQEYCLVITKSSHKPEEFNKICNMLSEYGSPEKADASVLAFLEEHCTILISADAVCKLSAL